MNSVFKKYIFIVASTLFLCGSILIAYQTSFHPLTAPSGSQVTNASEIISPPPSVEIDGTTIAVELATTSAAVAKGLSGRASLEQDRGMLFIFSRPDRYRFWMPNMHFPIDIIWLDDDNRVVDIDENVPHEFDPAHPVFFMPDSPARYVLELNAGFAKTRGITIDDTAIFHHIE